MTHILLIEDDASVREAVTAYLTRAGYTTTAAATGADGIEAYTAGGADLVLLDLMLPGGMGGFEIARRLRSIRRDLPLIMLTARDQEHERVQGLQHGADDYITKPFSLRELDLRIRSVLRRATPAPTQVAETLNDGDLVLDLAARSARRDDAALNLTGREFDLLAWFLQHPGTVFSRDELIREVWGWDVGDETTVTVHVRRLREKIEPHPSSPVRIVTVFGQGYRWDPQSSQAAS